MPEVSEIAVLVNYLSNVINLNFESIEILSGKYLNKPIKNIDKLKKNSKLINISSKGKLLCFEFDNDTFLTSHLGLTGFWNYDSDENDRLTLTFSNKTKKIILYYNDPRNFGNVEILNKKEFNNKLNLLAMDALKYEYSFDDFQTNVTNYINKSKTRTKQPIYKVLMEQTKIKGIVSGLGNYLTPEILYDCHLSPYREIGNIKHDELKHLYYSIKYITKLSYYNNNTGYMTHFNNFIQVNKQNIDDGIFQNYHPDIKIGNSEEFKFKVYKQKQTPNGSTVQIDKQPNGRSLYWSPNEQK